MEHYIDQELHVSLKRIFKCFKFTVLYSIHCHSLKIYIISKIRIYTLQAM